MSESQALPELTDEQKARCAALARTFPEVGDAIEAAMELGIEIGRSTLAAQPVACQYAIDVGMPEYRCAKVCQYDYLAPDTQETPSVARQKTRIASTRETDAWEADEAPAPASEDAPVVLPPLADVGMSVEGPWPKLIAVWPIDDVEAYARAAVLADRQSRAQPSTREAEDAARYQWIKANVAEEPLNARGFVGEVPDTRLRFKLPILVSWADYMGQLTLDDAIDHKRTAAAALDTKAAS